MINIFCILIMLESSSLSVYPQTFLHSNPIILNCSATYWEWGNTKTLCLAGHKSRALKLPSDTEECLEEEETYQRMLSRASANMGIDSIPLTNERLRKQTHIKGYKKSLLQACKYMMHAASLCHNIYYVCLSHMFFLQMITFQSFIGWALALCQPI